MATVLLPVFCLLLFGGSFFLACFPVVLAGSTLAKAATIFVAPFVYGFTYVAIAGVLSLFGRAAIVRGRFPRELRHPVYGRRRLYAFCWSSIFYFTPLYFVLLSFPGLKRVFFRLFGYRGNVNNTIAPDAWLRDLPLNDFGAGSYIANKATVGSNICLLDNTTFVEGVHLGDGAMLGHMSIIGPGVKIETSADIGVGCTLGVRARVQRRAKIGVSTVVGHGTDIGENADVGACSFVGLRVKIAGGLKLPMAMCVPSGSVLNTQDEVDAYFSSESHMLNGLRVSSLESLASELREPA